MKKEQEMEVIVYGEIELHKMQKDILDALIVALDENICKLMEKKKLDNEDIS